MSNTLEETALFNRVANMRQKHSCVLHDDGSVSIRRLDKDGFPIEQLDGTPLPNFDCAITALRWVDRIESIKPWERVWGGPL